MPGNGGRKWLRLVVLVPVLSVADLAWAVAAKMGYLLTFGLGLYKWENLHLMFQVGLVILLSIIYVVAAPSGEECYVVDAQEPGEKRAEAPEDGAAAGADPRG